MPGVWRAVSFCDGCAVIFHSPLGCAHVATLMDLGAQYRIIGDHQNEDLDAVPMISSNLQEKDSIFGGVEKLRGCITHVMETWKPQCLVIATSCVAGVIGDDVEQEAEDAETQYHVPVLCVPYGGFLGGDFTPLPNFSETRPVTEEESAIFDTAVGSYPMISAKAAEVASRAVPGGMEYLFTAQDTPRGPVAEDAPARFIKVYVLAEDGKAPVFTQVLR